MNGSDRVRCDLPVVLDAIDSGFLLLRNRRVRLYAAQDSPGGPSGGAVTLSGPCAAGYDSHGSASPQVGATAGIGTYGWHGTGFT